MMDDLAGWLAGTYAAVIDQMRQQHPNTHTHTHTHTRIPPSNQSPTNPGKTPNASPYLSPAARARAEHRSSAPPPPSRIWDKKK